MSSATELTSMLFSFPADSPPDLCDPTTAYQLKAAVPSRETIGFIGTTAGYRHTSSRYTAIGHCCLRGLMEALRVSFLSQSSRPLVLVRGHSLQYRMAELSLVY